MLNPMYPICNRVACPFMESCIFPDIQKTGIRGGYRLRETARECYHQEAILCHPGSALWLSKLRNEATKVAL